MSQATLFKRVARNKPRLAVKYMAHLAAQIQDGPSSAYSEALDARMSGNYSRVTVACDRAEDLREKFLGRMEMALKHGLS